jgi:hypothetical protein
MHLPGVQSFDVLHATWHRPSVQTSAPLHSESREHACASVEPAAGSSEEQPPTAIAVAPTTTRIARVKLVLSTTKFMFPKLTRVPREDLERKHVDQGPLRMMW